MKDTNSGTLNLNEQKKCNGEKPCYAHEYSKLIRLVSTIHQLRDEFEKIAFSRTFCDGLYSDELRSAWSKLDEILNVDVTKPLSACVIENLTHSKAEAV